MSSVAVIGLGNMGSAICGRLEPHYDVIGIGREPGSLAHIAEADVLIVAVKPQSFPALAEDMRHYVTNRQTVVSVMAGVTIQKLEDKLETTRIVRTMPNLALAVGRSVTAVFARNDSDIAATLSIAEKNGAK